ncbi:MAG: hypothetical protein JJU45_13365 [Acidimicrobiia bacterium]|nr:hypothetical protein [Acidimicrobiia bacterium]
MSALGIIVWTWAAVSLAAWIWLRINKRKGLDFFGRPLDGVTSGSPHAAATADELAAKLDPRRARGARSATAAPPSTPPAAPPTSTAGSDPLAPVPMTAAQPMAPPVVNPPAGTDVTTSTAAIWGDDVPTDAPPSVRSDGPDRTDPNRSASVVDALQGVSWPCDLTPLVDMNAPSLATRRATFTTGSADGPTVGAAVAAALRKAGFIVWSPSAGTLMADRAPDRVELVLYPRAALAAIAGQRRFPDVPTNNVLIECEVI